MTTELEALKLRFVARCADDRARLAEVVEAGDLAGTKLLAHKLAGAAGTFGFPALSEAALAVEDGLDLGEGLDPARLAALDARLEEVARG